MSLDPELLGTMLNVLIPQSIGKLQRLRDVSKTLRESVDTKNFSLVARETLRPF